MHSAITAFLHASRRTLSRPKPSPSTATKQRAMARPARPAVDKCPRMLQELTIVLNAEAVNRRVFRHLVFVEESTARRGAVAFDTVPVRVLTKAVEQLDLLALSWSSRELVALNGRLMSAVALRSGDMSHRQNGAFDRIDTTQDVARCGRPSSFFMLADERIPECDRTLGRIPS